MVQASERPADDAGTRGYTNHHQFWEADVIAASVASIARVARASVAPLDQSSQGSHTGSVLGRACVGLGMVVMFAIAAWLSAAQSPDQQNAASALAMLRSLPAPEATSLS